MISLTLQGVGKIRFARGRMSPLHRKDDDEAVPAPLYQPGGDPPPADLLEKLMDDVLAVNHELRAAGASGFSEGLHAPSTATLLDPPSKEMPMTDGRLPRPQAIAG